MLRSGDALMLYTDGMVETRTADIGIGIDRLIGQADRRLRGNFAGGAATLVDSVGRPVRRPGPAAGLARLTSDGRRRRGSADRRRGRCGTMTSRVARDGRPRSRTMRGRSSMVEPQSSKLMTRVRFPSSARRWSPEPDAGRSRLNGA